jgi:hypothetical protein
MNQKRGCDKIKWIRITFEDNSTIIILTFQSPNWTKLFRKGAHEYEVKKHGFLTSEKTKRYTTKKMFYCLDMVCRGNICVDMRREKLHCMVMVPIFEKDEK